MTPEQVVDLLTAAATRDRRTIGKADVLAWHTDVGDLPFDDALEAVGIHFRESTDWLMPAHIRRIVTRIRDDRGGGVPGPGLPPEVPDADPDDVPAYLAAIREQRTKAAAGQDVPAIEAGAPVDPDGNPQARRILAEFRARQEAARRRKAEEEAAEREALRVYRDAVKTLTDLDLPDRVAAVMARAREELLGDEQAALGYPLLAAAPGVTDEHKVTIRAARLVAEEEPPCAPTAD